MKKSDPTRLTRLHLFFLFPPEPSCLVLRASEVLQQLVTPDLSTDLNLSLYFCESLRLAFDWSVRKVKTGLTWSLCSWTQTSLIGLRLVLLLLPVSITKKSRSRNQILVRCRSGLRDLGLFFLYFIHVLNQSEVSHQHLHVELPHWGATTTWWGGLPGVRLYLETNWARLTGSVEALTSWRDYISHLPRDFFLWILPVWEGAVFWVRKGNLGCSVSTWLPLLQPWSIPLLLSIVCLAHKSVTFHKHSVLHRRICFIAFPTCSPFVT